MTNRHRGLTKQAADAAVDSACRMLRLPTIRSQFPDLAEAALPRRLHGESSQQPAAVVLFLPPANVPRVKSPVGYSRCFINARQNSNGGNWLGRLYGTGDGGKRVLDGDKLYVRIK